LADAYVRAPDVEAVDMAVATFRAHTDCVYTAAIHPTQRNTVITGRASLSVLCNFACCVCVFVCKCAYMCVCVVF
jgi:hypothetical protein